MNPIPIYIVMMLIGQLFAGQVMAEVYRWTDKDGNIHFSDKPQTDNAKQVKIHSENREDGSEQPSTSQAKSVQQIANEMEAARLEREKQRKSSSGQRANAGHCLSNKTIIDSLREKIKVNERTYDRFNHSRYRETKKMKEDLQELQADYNNYCQ